MKNLTGNILYVSRYLVVTVLFVISHFAYGQLTRPGVPLPLDYPGAKPIIIYELNISPGQKQMAKSQSGQSVEKSAETGVLLPVNYTVKNSGNWDTLVNGTKLWRIAFRAKGVIAMDVIFSPYRVQKGVKVFLYDSTQQHVLGALSDLNNKPGNILATSEIPGDLLVVEIQIPQTIDSLGQLTISNIGCSFASFFSGSTAKDGYFGSSAYCNADINCYIEPKYQQAKNSVVRILYRGTDLCTGVLINNTALNGKSYVLTAHHCLGNDFAAYTAVFAFDYESPYCGGPDGDASKTVSGSILRATGEVLDYSLVELLEPIPFTYKPYFAGWDITGNDPQNGYIIHHPWGDVKKIAFDNELIPSGSREGFPDNSFWWIHQYDVGTTEKGSSGSPLFDQNNRVVGTLDYGVSAICPEIIDDLYQQFKFAWEENSDTSAQLKHWLNPSTDTYYFIDGYDPYKSFWDSGDTLSNILPAESLDTLKNNLSWGYLSGDNSDHISQFAEKYANTGTKSVLGLMVDVAKNYVGSYEHQITFRIWEGKRYPEKLIAEKSIPLIDLATNVENFVEFNPVASVTDTFFVGYEIDYNQPEDTFAVWMAENREDKPNSAFVYNTHWESLNEYTGNTIYSSYAIYPIIYTSVPEVIKPQDIKGNLLAYPNPVKDILTIKKYYDLFIFPVTVQFFDLAGRLVSTNNFGSEYEQSLEINISGLNNGIYIVKVKEDFIVHYFKISIIK